MSHVLSITLLSFYYKKSLLSLVNSLMPSPFYAPPLEQVLPLASGMPFSPGPLPTPVSFAGPSPFFPDPTLYSPQGSVLGLLFPIDWLGILIQFCSFKWYLYFTTFKSTSIALTSLPSSRLQFHFLHISIWMFHRHLKLSMSSQSSSQSLLWSQSSPSTYSYVKVIFLCCGEIASCLSISIPFSFPNDIISELLGLANHPA